MKFYYWNNKQNPPKLIAEIESENILSADKELEKQTGFNPVKCSWIGCSLQPK